MNVLIVSGYWTTRSLEGGVRRHVVTLVRELKRKHQVTVLVPSWGHVRLVREVIDGVTVYRRRMATAPSSADRLVRQVISWLLNLPGTLAALRRIVREQKIDVVHIHQVTAGSAFSFWLLHKLGGPPYVVGFHGRETRDYNRLHWLARRQMDLLIGGAAHGVAVSEHLAKLGRDNGWRADPLTVIPNGSDLVGGGAAGVPAARQPGSLGSAYFVMLGRLHEVKGQDLAIRAWRWVCEKYPDVHLVLVGDYPSGGGYEGLVEQSGCPDRIHLVGRQSHVGALGWLAGACGLIQASRSEGGAAPFAVLEAAMLEVPVIASGIPSLREVIVHEQTGLIVNPEDPQAIAIAVERLVDDPALRGRLAKGLSQYVRANLTASRMADRYAEVYRAVVPRPIQGNPSSESGNEA